MTGINDENVLSYSVFHGFMGFDAARRFGKNEITVICDENSESRPITVHVKHSFVLRELEKHLILKPWGDRYNTVPNMRLFEGSLEEFLEMLGVVYELRELR